MIFNLVSLSWTQFNSTLNERYKLLSFISYEVSLGLDFMVSHRSIIFYYMTSSETVNNVCGILD